MELDVIAAVVIGGTAFTGGQGYVVGAIFGALISPSFPYSNSGNIQFLVDTYWRWFSH